MLTGEFWKRIYDAIKYDITQRKQEILNLVFVGTCTGSGKSLIYESIHVIKPGIIVVVNIADTRN